MEMVEGLKESFAARRASKFIYKGGWMIYDWKENHSLYAYINPL